MRTVNRKHGLGLHRAAYPAPGKWEGDAGVGLGPRQQASQPRRVTAHRLVVCRAVMLGWGRWCGAWSVMGRRGKGGGGVGDGEVPLNTSANRGETANGAHRQAASCLISVQRALFDDLVPHYCTPAPLWAGSNTRNGIRPVAVLQDQWARAATGASSVRAMPKWAHCRCGGVTTTASSAAVVVADEAVGVVIGVAAAAALCSIVIRLRAAGALAAFKRTLVQRADAVIDVNAAFCGGERAAATAGACSSKCRSPAWPSCKRPCSGWQCLAARIHGMGHWKLIRGQRWGRCRLVAPQVLELRQHLLHSGAARGGMAAQRGLGNQGMVAAAFNWRLHPWARKTGASNLCASSGLWRTGERPWGPSNGPPAPRSPTACQAQTQAACGAW